MADEITIKGFKAKVSYDPVSNTYRGEFDDFSGGADFYASSKNDLQIEGQLSLEIFLSLCEDADIDPYKC